MKDHQAKWTVSSKFLPWESCDILQPAVLYAKVMDQGQLRACGLDLAVGSSRMMQPALILIGQKKSIKVWALKLSQPNQGYQSYICFCDDHSFWSNEEIARVYFVASGAKSVNVTYLLASLLSWRYYWEDAYEKKSFLLQLFISHLGHKGKEAKER